MNRIVFVFILVLLGGSVSAQTTLSVAGGSSSAAGVSLSYSVGQVATSHTSNGSFSCHEGVVQPSSYTVVGLEECRSLPKLTVYPNPTSDGVTIERDDASSPLRVELYAADGRRVSTIQWATSSSRIDMSAYGAGIYLLSVREESDKSNNQVSTYKITKK